MLRLLPVRNPAELLVVPGHFSYPRYERLRDYNGVFAEMFGTHVLPTLEVSLSGQPAGGERTFLWPRVDDHARRARIHAPLRGGCTVAVRSGRPRLLLEYRYTTAARP